MDSGHALYLAQLLDQVNANLDAFPLPGLGARLLVRGRQLVLALAGPWRAGFCHPLNQFIGDQNTGHVFLHILRHARAFQRADAGQNVSFLVDAKFAHLFHELLESLNIVDQLRLDEVRAGLDFFLQAIRPEFHRVRER